MKLRPRLLRWLRRVRIARLELLAHFVPAAVRWIQHSTAGEPGPQDLTVVCLVKDSQQRVSAFLDYYLDLGARHIVLADNGSTDETVERACRSDERVSVLRCPLEFRRFQIPIKMWLSWRFSGLGWCLVADIDEYLAVPLARQAPLPAFLSYLNAHHFSGVVLQTVDLFSNRPVAEWPETGEALRADCVWYDHSLLTHPTERRSFSMNRIRTTDIRPCFGGIKRRAFGLDRLLTKHVLIRPALGARLNGPHHSRGASIADVSAALLHYPFDRTFPARCVEAVRRGNYWERSRDYRVMQQTLEAGGGGWSLAGPTARRLDSVDQLVEEGYLVVSDEYRRHVQALHSVSSAVD